MNTLLPDFPREREHDRTDHQARKAKHLESAEAAHEHPAKRRHVPSRPTKGRTILSPKKSTTQPKPNASERRRC